MRDIALTEWEHQPRVLEILTSREMGAWLGRRDSRLLQEIRREINNINPKIDRETETDSGEMSATVMKSLCLKTIDAKIAEYTDKESV